MPIQFQIHGSVTVLAPVGCLSVVRRIYLPVAVLMLFRFVGSAASHAVIDEISQDAAIN